MPRGSQSLLVLGPAESGIPSLCFFTIPENGGRGPRRPYCWGTGVEEGFPFSTMRVAMNLTGASLELMPK